MDGIWQWAWDRCGKGYSWALYALLFPLVLPLYLVPSFVVVAYQQSGRYTEAAAAAAVSVLAGLYLMVLPGHGWSRGAEQWAAAEKVDRLGALTATYSYARRAGVRWLTVGAIWNAVLLPAVGQIAGASGSRLVQYAVLGAVTGGGLWLIGAHSLIEGMMRPMRVALVGDTDIGDSLPRSRPTFAEWTSLSVLAVGLSFAIAGAMLAAVFGRVSEEPVLWVLIGAGLTFFFSLPLTVGLNFSPSLRPIRDLAEGTERVTAGDYGQRLPVVQDDDLGALVASFNRMQAGLTERQRLQAAFGTYVDPSLASRLLAQGDDVFTGERREVTVMFVDVRDFTPFAEANSAEDVVACLNELFDIVVPAVLDAGGHVNKFLGDGALAVFGAPNDLVHHADAAVSAAVVIHRLVAERFGGALRIGIGVNTGEVIAGTIGGAGKLEFTLIGDTVNVAARVEQLTKTTGDAILLTDQTAEALTTRPSGLVDQGSHGLKGKSAAVKVLGLDPAVTR